MRAVGTVLQRVVAEDGELNVRGLGRFRVYQNKYHYRTVRGRQVLIVPKKHVRFRPDWRLLNEVNGYLLEFPEEDVDIDALLAEVRGG